MNAMEMSRSKNQPPLLPTHLFHKILLNQDTSLSFEPSLLLVPNSTQLNHLRPIYQRGHPSTISNPQVSTLIMKLSRTINIWRTVENSADKSALPETRKDNLQMLDLQPCRV